jgi:methylthioribulose-1-phosphate dehydratase
LPRLPPAGYECAAAWVRPGPEVRRPDLTDFATATRAIVETGQRLDRRGLAPASAGNYSMRLGDGSIAITVSGAHKGRLTAEQVMRVAPDGTPLDDKKPSAETLLHCLVYEINPSAGAVLHTHSVAGTVLSRMLAGSKEIGLSGYEVLKIYPHCDTHETSVAMPLVDNSQDMVALSAQMKPLLTGQSPLLPAFYIREHGLYAWGPDMEAAENVVEASEFLLACEWEVFKLKGETR